MLTEAASIYTVGGAVGGGLGVYLPRQADADLPALCRAGTFAYVLAPRQIGKTSLMIHTAAALAADGCRTVLIDLTAIGAGVTAEAWYFGLLYEIADQLDLPADLPAWWDGHAHLGLAQRFTRFFHELVAPAVAAPVVVFVDEIDTTLGLDFTDDFFAAIRSLHDARARAPALARLSFVLIGVATPGDLIQDPKRTPFNIGRRVDLTDFSFEEALPLAEGLDLPPALARQVLGWVLAWTGGHPYLTQRLCQAITQEGREEWSAAAVDALVARLFFGAASGQDNNLQFVRDMLTKRAPDPATVLTTYAAIRQERRPVPDEEQSLVKAHLKLSGVVRREGGALRVRNPIYRAVFDPQWVRAHLPPAVDWVRWLRRALVALVILFVVTVAGLGLLAEARRQEAEAARTLAEARELVIRAQTAADPEVGLLLAVEAGRRLQAGYVADAEGQIARVLLDSLAASQVRVRLDHPAAVTGVAWGPTGQWLLTTSVDGQARVWRVDGPAGTPPALRAVWGDDAPIQVAAWSGDGRLIATADQAGTLRLWDATAILAGGPPAPRQTWRGHDGEILSVAFSPDGQRLVTTGRDATARIWDVATGREVLVLRGHTGWVRSAAFSPDGQRIATAGADVTVRVWDAATGVNLATLRGHVRDVRSVAWSPDGRSLITGSEDRTARVWDTGLPIDGTPEELVLRGHEAEVTGAAWSLDWWLLATGSRDGTVKVWNPAAPAGAGQEPLTLRGHTTAVLAVAWSPDGRRLASAGADGTALIWQAAPAPEQDRLDRLGELTAAAYTPDGGRLIAGGADGSLTAWDVNTPPGRQELFPGPSMGIAMRVLAISPDGRRLVTVDDMPLGQLSALDTDQVQWRLAGLRDGVEAAAWSPDSGRLATVGVDGAVRLWDGTRGQALAELRGHGGAVRAVAWSPDGRWVLTGGVDNTARIWDSATGQVVLIVRGHEEGVVAVAWRPDGRLFATSDGSGATRLWEAAASSGQGRLRAVLRGPVAGTVLAWNADGQLLATAGVDGLVQVWDAEHGTERLSLRGSDAVVLALAWSPDSRFLSVAGADGVARRYALRLEDLLVLAQSRLTRALTPAEWEQFGLAPTPTPFAVAAAPTLPPPTLTAPPSATPAPAGGATPTPPAPPAPPGGWIAFASNRGDPLQSHIYVMQADGAGQRVLTTAPRYNLYPDWAPDGRQIVYVGADPRLATSSPGGDLYLMQADGSGQHRLTRDLNAKWPRWAPDGTAILYADAPENTAAAYDLYLLTLADGAIRRLTDTPGFDGMAAWTPDGRIIFASARVDGKNTHLYRMRADGTDVQPLVLAPGWQDSPAVAPGGGRIAFVSTQDGTERIYTVAADGSDSRQLTTGPGVDRYPSWSPDGRWIAFHSNRDARSNFEIYRVPAGGGAAQRLTTDPAFDDEPAWRP